MKVFFADTFYFLALLNPDDQHHRRVTAFSRSFEGRVVTTEWVFLEVADALAGDSRLRPKVVQLIHHFSRPPRFRAVEANSLLLHRGLDHYARRPDKAWSLTDCTSFVVMADEGIFEALTEDHHFEQAGYTAVFAR